MPFVSKKGVACNHLAATQVNGTLQAGDWFHTDAPTVNDSYWQKPPTGITTGIQYVPHLYDGVPTAWQIANAQANNYLLDNWWMIGSNEPDGAGYAFSSSPATIAALAVAQIDAVKGVISNPKFCLSAGSQYHAPGNPFTSGGNSFPVWIDALLNALGATYRSYIKAIAFHWYAQVELGGSHADIFKQSPINQNLNRWNTWRYSGQGYTYFPSGIQLWMTEIGLWYSHGSPTDVSDSHADMDNYPLRIQLACDDKLIERWSWYGFKDTCIKAQPAGPNACPDNPGDLNYVDLWNDEANSSGLSTAGTAFAAI